MAVSTIKTRGCRPQTLIRPLSAPVKSGNFNYTAPSDGILYLVVITTARAYWSLKWNGQEIVDSAQNPKDSSTASAVTIPVFCKKGDVIQAGTFSASCYVASPATAFISFE